MHFSTDASTTSDFGNYIQPVSENQRDMVSRNLSIISFGGNMRHMSITSEATFGRAMSGLSALSIDWENMEDFDVNIDHSAHINNGMMDVPTGINVGGRRSSMRRSINAMHECGRRCGSGSCRITARASGISSRNTSIV
jgi:hypothetical protein